MRPASPAVGSAEAESVKVLKSLEKASKVLDDSSALKLKLSVADTMKLSVTDGSNELSVAEGSKESVKLSVNDGSKALSVEDASNVDVSSSDDEWWWPCLWPWPPKRPNRKLLIPSSVLVGSADAESVNDAESVDVGITELNESVADGALNESVLNVADALSEDCPSWSWW